MLRDIAADDGSSLTEILEILIITEHTRRNQEFISQHTKEMYAEAKAKAEYYAEIDSVMPASPKIQKLRKMPDDGE